MQRTMGAVSAQDAMAMLGPGDILIDCTGSKSVLRDHLLPGVDARVDANTFKIRLEYALVVTFLYGRPYDCNEHCKYYKNIDNPRYKFIPAVNRTYYDGSITHVTGIVSISAQDYEEPLLDLPDSLHTDGFYTRESNIVRRLTNAAGLDGAARANGGQIVGAVGRPARGVPTPR